MEWLTVIKCPATRGHGGYCSGRPNPSIIGTGARMHYIIPDYLLFVMM